MCVHVALDGSMIVNYELERIYKEGLWSRHILRYYPVFVWRNKLVRPEQHINAFVRSMQTGFIQIWSPVNITFRQVYLPIHLQINLNILIYFN
jgi:hypothetical protein